MLRISLLLFLLPLSIVTYAQKTYTISGTLTDASTGETLIGATVKLKEIPQASSASNSYGFYAISAPQGRYTLIASFVGFKTVVDTITLEKDQKINLSLQPQTAIEEVVISGNRRNNNNVSSPQMGLEKLNMTQINQLPVVLGEQDILKSITLMPGIKSSGEGNTGYYVRGGGSDQNLILLDEATVYNAAHLLGFSEFVFITYW